MQKKLKQGFTLIELLVVMAIIAILVTLMIYAINAARMQSRNTQRRGTANSAKTALESFFASRKCYPRDAAGTTLCTTNGLGAAIQLDTLLGGAALTSYISASANATTFSDPIGEQGRQCYQQNGPGRYYMWILVEPDGAAATSCAAIPAAGTAGFEDFSL
ncbi:hypothetical protein AUK11_00890 [bacterium CG2_30_37_16]|nr:MAG: hypothetical protein AUK11_00890 [bacterium CG2_30_37_16]PIP31193.1 MAG: hypothetical protein COX25_00615 [bacterium (Candidatus Howlettbacteria) CG23_combo_of_CG06-09_8_20_14_all_37_9]PIX99114.1 MAG: hypothetical protein COZ22_03365 [bacterium (Candidatus Howlettbacteria) CG_4_10_14_3_um_filter_37_10]PJB06448.1 MAG: hypothetical protein CO123_02125 [bacterium (Candidatus Howlettbacteria) CG_4_9_14_3_um_filter_37_10]